ncbi:MAG: ATP-binding cassette, subfamily er 3 [Campylobacterota bacterium]|nr:ATP-binding cassette, subfamily er 3 [Campylobacterota bacterium]
MIQLVNVSKSFATNPLFIDLNFKLNSKNRVGLVGRNGSGKSTLFKIILGEEPYDSGEIIIPKGYKIGALKQHLEFSEDTIVKEVALALGKDEEYDIYKVEKTLFGLGFSKDDLQKNPLSFSGGYQIRLNLAKLLIAKPNLLLLDEPTNYLDILSLRWLRTFLKNFEGEVIIITHDRDFMDSVTTHTMGIVRKNLAIIEGNTHKFYAQLAANDELYEKDRLSQEKKKKELEEFIAKNRVRASTAALAQSKMKLLEKMDTIDELSYDKELCFDFNYAQTPAKIMLEVKDLSFGYTQDKILFKNISFSLAKGEVLAIIGKNGKGKSTLLNVIATELKPLSGTINSHPSIVSAHFGQTNINRLNLDNTIIDEIYSASPKLPYATIRAICGAMMFSGESAEKKVSLLSGGEKSRVMLGQILAKSVNLLFLDEPTNHLDMESIESLIEALQRFEGSSIIVTHSEELLRRVATRLIVFAKEGAFLFDGSYDEFLEKIGWDEEENEQKQKEPQKSSYQENKKARASLVQERSKIISPLKKEIEKLENEIMKKEELLENQNSELLEASNALESKKVIDLSKAISLLQAQIDESFDKLEVLHDKLDKITKEYEQKLAELE